MAAPLTTLSTPQPAAAVSESPSRVEMKAPVSSTVRIDSVPAVKPTDVDTQTDRATSMKDVQRAVDTLRSAVDKYAPSLNIAVDGELNKLIVRVTDADTNEMIRQIPAQELLDIARFFERNGVETIGSDSLRGMLVDEYS